MIPFKVFQCVVLLQSDKFGLTAPTSGSSVACENFVFMLQVQNVSKKN